MKRSEWMSDEQQRKTKRKKNNNNNDTTDERMNDERNHFLQHWSVIHILFVIRMTYEFYCIV